MSEQLSLPGLEIRDYHDFKEKLIQSRKSTKFERLDFFYRACFPDILQIEKTQNKTLQRQGIDSIITLTNGKQIYFDEKCRSKYWNDILLEEFSVWPFAAWNQFQDFKKYRIMLLDPQHRNFESIFVDNRDPVPNAYQRFLKQGWMSGQKLTDYITYIFESKKIVYFLPFLLLRKAWTKYYSRWLEDYSRKFARNRTYLTSNIPVPTEVLFKALYEQAHYHSS